MRKGLALKALEMSGGNISFDSMEGVIHEGSFANDPFCFRFCPEEDFDGRRLGSVGSTLHSGARHRVVAFALQLCEDVVRCAGSVDAADDHRGV